MVQYDATVTAWEFLMIIVKIIVLASSLVAAPVHSRNAEAHDLVNLNGKYATWILLRGRSTGKEIDLSSLENMSVHHVPKMEGNSYLKIFLGLLLQFRSLVLRRLS